MGGRANAPINEGVNFLDKFDPNFLQSLGPEFATGLGREFEVGQLGGVGDERPPEQARASLLLKADFMTRVLDRAHGVADARITKLRRRVKLLHGVRLVLELGAAVTSAAVLALLRVGEQLGVYISAWAACSTATASVFVRFLERVSGLNQENIYSLYKNVWAVASGLRLTSEEISFAKENNLDSESISALIARANAEIAGANRVFAEFL